MIKYNISFHSYPDKLELDSIKVMSANTLL